MGMSYAHCGQSIYKGCLNLGYHPEAKAYVKRQHNSCDRFECPICYPFWLRKRSRVVRNRMEAGIKEQRSDRRKPIHVSLSPAPEFWDRYAENDPKYFRYERRKAARIAKQAGIDGGALIFHAYREKCLQCGESVAERDIDGKICPRCDCQLFVWRFSPHFHVIGYGWIIWTREDHQRTRWVVKNHLDGDVRRSVYGTVHYILSHSTKKRSQNKVVSWIGNLSIRSMGKTPKTRNERKTCPHCQTPLGQIQKKGFDDHEPIPENCLIDGTGWEYVSTLSRKPRRTPSPLPPWTQIGTFARKPKLK